MSWPTVPYKIHLCLCTCISYHPYICWPLASPETGQDSSHPCTLWTLYIFFCFSFCQEDTVLPDFCMADFFLLIWSGLNYLVTPLREVIYVRLLRAFSVVCEHPCFFMAKTVLGTLWAPIMWKMKMSSEESSVGTSLPFFLDIIFLMQLRSYQLFGEAISLCCLCWPYC